MKIRRYTLKENLVSVAIGIAIGVPLSLVSLHCQNKKMQEELEARKQIIEEQRAAETDREEIPMEKASTEPTSQSVQPMIRRSAPARSTGRRSHTRREARPLIDIEKALT